jgi:hypothetical protein
VKLWGRQANSFIDSLIGIYSRFDPNHTINYLIQIRNSQKKKIIKKKLPPNTDK